MIRIFMPRYGAYIGTHEEYHQSFQWFVEHHPGAAYEMWVHWDYLYV